MVGYYQPDLVVDGYTQAKLLMGAAIKTLFPNY